ncbi:hypothetical protein SMC26_39835 [Actinomadura fulvescens]|uniref:Uncharacterized protein n=1 Tax=Actinomadura fulvescens TaxID=46160 RepID=A0ABN3QYN6_9ACTN
MVSLDRPREADREQSSSPPQAALEALAALLRGQRYAVEVHDGNLVAADGAGVRPVRVWCQSRDTDGGRLWFAWSGAVWICEADKPTDAITAVKGAFGRVRA